MGTNNKIFKLIRKLRYSILVAILFFIASFASLSIPISVAKDHYRRTFENLPGKEINIDYLRQSSDNLFNTLFLINGLISVSVASLYLYINYRKFKFIYLTKMEVDLQQQELKDLIDAEKEKKSIKDKQEEIAFRLALAHSNSRNLKNVISGVNHEVAPWLGIVRNVSNMLTKYLHVKNSFTQGDYNFILGKIKEIESSATQCIGIVDNLSKNIKYLQKYDMTTANIASTIRAMVSVALLNSSIRKNLRASQIDVDYESLDFVCKHSPMFLHQILLNLVNNAIDHNSHMREKLQIRIYGDKKAKTLFVEDNGKGITPDVMQNIFTPNFTTKDDHMDSHGLGLAMCMDYAVSMGAYIDVRSIVDKETIFFIEFETKIDDDGSDNNRLVGTASNVYKAYKQRKEKTKQFDTSNNSGFLAKVEVDLGDIGTDVP